MPRGSDRSRAGGPVGLRSAGLERSRGVVAVDRLVVVIVLSARDVAVGVVGHSLRLAAQCVCARVSSRTPDNRRGVGPRLAQRINDRATAIEVIAERVLVDCSGVFGACGSTQLVGECGVLNTVLIN